MEIEQVQAFLAIALQGGFSKAASTLYKSQPAITRRIQMLENELGFLLFERNRAGVVLTEAGKMFFPHAQRIVAAVRDAVDAVKSLEQGDQGAIQLAMVGSLAGTELTHKLIAFRRRFPKVQLKLSTARSREVSEMVLRGEVQIGIRYFVDPSDQLVSQKIGSEKLVLVCSIHKKLKRQKLFEQLENLPWVIFPAGSSGEPFTEVVQRQIQKVSLRLPHFINIDSLTAQKRLIEADFGIGMLPLSSIQDELRSKMLRMVPVPALETRVPIVALYRRDGYLSKAARALLQTL